MKKQQKAFTLAETLITLTILGVVAAITVPMLINKQMEAANRAKVKMAMATYDKALSQMILDNDIKNNIGAALNTPDCSITSPYFKKINGEHCRFQTADKVWWDITDIEHPLISLKDKITTDEEAISIKANADGLDKDKTSFVFVGYEENGVLRINDRGTATDTDGAKNKTYLDKLYGFMGVINNETKSMSPQKIFYDKFLNNGYSDCKNTYEECSEHASNVCTNCKIKVNSPNDNRYDYLIYYYDKDGNLVGAKSHDKNDQFDLLSIYYNPGVPTYVNGIAKYDGQNLFTYYNEGGGINRQVASRLVKVGKRSKTLNLTYNYDDKGNYVDCSSSIPDDYDCEELCDDTVYKCK